MELRSPQTVNRVGQASGLQHRFQRSRPAGSRPQPARLPYAALLSLIATGAFGSEVIRIEARHDHLWKSCSGVLRLTDGGVQFEGPKHSFVWAYGAIQQLRLAEDDIQLTTYRDRLTRAGADEVYRFSFLKPQEAPWREIYARLQPALSGRLIAAVPITGGDEPVWQSPAKLLGRWKGSIGTVIAYPDRLVFRTGLEGQSYTWRDAGIDNISLSDPLRLSLVANRKEYVFQLQQPMSEEQFRNLWLRLNRAKGLEVIETYQKGK